MNSTREPVGSETIACFATCPVRTEVSDTVRKIVYDAIAKARAATQQPSNAIRQ